MFCPNNKIVSKRFLAFMTLCFLSVSLFAQEAEPVRAAQGNNYDSLRYILLAVALVLAFVILILSKVAGITGEILVKKQKKEKEKNEAKGVVLSLILLFVSAASFAQDKPAAKAAGPATSSLPWDIYLSLGVIALEAIVILFLVRTMYGFLERQKEKSPEAKSKLSFFQRISKPIPAEEESKLDLHHDYDGIRELDNNIPGWWKLAFFGTFIFSIIYFYRMFGSESMPLQGEELAMANAIAEIQRTEYLQHAANNIDENTVKLMGSEDITAGRELYIKNCVACHGDKGQGGVGPNFTDEYWMHKGSLRDIFYSIKYGWQEKGMKAWKDDFSPKQIAQITNFIHTLKNTNVPGGKEKQGEIYKDSTSLTVGVSEVK